jgi:hypothetical protein
MKPDDLSPAEGVAKHELFHFSVRRSAPMTSRQESETDSHLSLDGIPLVVTRRPYFSLDALSITTNALPDANAPAKNPFSKTCR